jgi:hypothetical protein
VEAGRAGENFASGLVTAATGTDTSDRKRYLTQVFTAITPWRLQGGKR